MGLIERLINLGYNLDSAIDIFYKHIGIGCIDLLEKEITEMEEQRDELSDIS